MSKFIFYLGHNPHISELEIKSVLKNSQIIDKNEKYIVLQTDFNTIPQLGGCPKVAKVININNLNTIEEDIVHNILESKNNQKIKYGVLYENKKNANLPRQNELIKNIKKSLRKDKLNSRFLNNNFKNYSSILSFNEKMQNNHEFNIIKINQNSYLTKTVYLQDIELYTKIDIYRPYKDSINGMTPPKLALTLINLSGLTPKTIYDPFCGDGTILMMAKILNNQVYGSDYQESKVEATKANLTYSETLIKNNKNTLNAQKPVQEENNLNQDSEANLKIFHHDITKSIDQSLEESKKNKENIDLKNIDIIITEGYLGNIYKNPPTQREAEKQIPTLIEVYTSLLSLGQKLNCPIIVSLPNIKTQTSTVSLFNHIESSLNKYNYQISRLNGQKTMIYGRSYQIVKRELLYLKPNKQIS